MPHILPRRGRDQSQVPASFLIDPCKVFRRPPLLILGGVMGPENEREMIMKTTNTIQHALFRTIDSLDRQTLRDGNAVRELLIQHFCTQQWLNT
jgi:hypothetical protein